MSIFATEAPKYWAAGLPAIPLMEKQKRPAIQRWQMFADTFPTEEERKIWLEHFPNGNIGLPMGAISGLVAMDVDTDDPAVLRVLDQLLPKSPWTRVGKKGYIRVYRYTAERTTRIKTATGMVCEILSKGTQFVLPPSIHPDTGLPYTANGNLYEVAKSAPPLPPGIEELIRSALKDIGYEVSLGGGTTKTTVFVPAGARDNSMVSMAGLLARAVVRGERSLLNALGEMEEWVNSFVEKVIGDQLSVDKAKAKVVEFVIRDVTGEKRQALPLGWDEGLSVEDKKNLGIEFTAEDEKWPATKIIEFLRQEFERFSEPGDAGRIVAIEAALDKIARAQGFLSVLDEERILKFIQSQSINSMTVSGLKKQLAVLRRGDIAGESHEEIAKAAIKFISQFGELRFYAGSFWQWKGANWEKKEQSDIMNVIQTEFGNYPACRRYSDYAGVYRVMQNPAKALKQINLKGLNFANGFLTEEFQLLGHNPDHGMTYVLPYRYMPELAGHMPMFNQYLADSWSEDPDYLDKVAALQEAMGATLFSSAPSYQRAVCLFGQPGSGKSQVSEIMKGVLPTDSVSSVPPQDWGDRFLPTQMFGKVLNMAGELSETRSIPGDLFKQIVEGAEVSAQYKNQDIFQFRPTCAQWFASNFLPKTRDSSDGFNRRWLILEWNKRVDPGKKIIDLHQVILESETEAIVAWAVEGFARLRKNKEYTLPSSHLACIDQMSTDNNSVRYFLTTSPRIIVGSQKMGDSSKKETTAVALHGEYWSFCIGIGIAQRVSLQRFISMMKELEAVFGFQQVVENNTVSYRYIILAANLR